MNETSVLNIDGKNMFRPFFQSMTEQDPNIATIVLLSNPTETTKDTLDVGKNYLTNFTSKINPIGIRTDSHLQVDTSKSVPLLTLDGFTGYYGIFNNFSLLNVSEQRESIVKVHNNFGGSWNAFFLGDRVKVFNFSGFFLDSKEYPYYQEFLIAYDKYLSGRKSIENNMELQITYDGKIITGYILNITTTLNSTNPFAKSFMFSVLVKSEGWFRNNAYYYSNGSIANKNAYNTMSNIARIKSINAVNEYTTKEPSPAEIPKPIETTDVAIINLNPTV